MQWFTRITWKMGIIVTDILLLLLLMTWIPLTATEAHGIAESGRVVATRTVTVQVTPTVDATVTALNREKLLHENDWWWNYGATILTSIISTLVLAAAGIFTVIRYFNDRRDVREKQEAEEKRLAEDRKAEREHRDEEQQRWLKDKEIEREKRAEERFQSAIEGLGSEREDVKVGAAIMLRTFLHPSYEQFYVQAFDLATVNLRLPRTPHPPKDPSIAVPLTPLRQALIMIFKEAFPLARSQQNRDPQSLDATGIQLDTAYLRRADLKQVWMPQAVLRNADLESADLSSANLESANLSGANLYNAILSEINLINAILIGANLNEVNLSGAALNKIRCIRATFSKANLSRAIFTEVILDNIVLAEANLKEANLRGVSLKKAILWGADLSGADLYGAVLTGATLINANLSDANLHLAGLEDANLAGADLSRANLSNIRFWKGTKLHRVKGLTKEQLADCKAKGAIIDEDTMISSSKIPISTPIQSQSTDVQVQSGVFAQDGHSSPNVNATDDTKFDT